MNSDQPEPETESNVKTVLIEEIPEGKLLSGPMNPKSIPPGGVCEPGSVACINSWRHSCNSSGRWVKTGKAC
jgi:hypothetical protein